MRAEVRGRLSRRSDGVNLSSKVGGTVRFMTHRERVANDTIFERDADLPATPHFHHATIVAFPFQPLASTSS